MRVRPKKTTILKFGIGNVAYVTLEPHQIWEATDNRTGDVALSNKQVAIIIGYADFKKYFKDLRK